MADPLDKRYAKYKEPFMKPVGGKLMQRAAYETPTND